MKQSASQKSRDIDEETTTLVRSYRIPRKEKESKNILQEIQFDSREYQQDVCPILKQNYYQRNESERNYQYVHCYLVHNSDAANQFENRKKELKAKYCYTEKDLALTHGFLEVSSVEEARNICKDGLECGNRVFGSLGRPDMGIYLSRHSDMLNAAPSASGTTGTMIIFKIIKGRIKYVPLVSAHLEPTPGFDSHVAKVASSELQGASPIKLFESLQIYLYEYDDTEIVHNVRHICPMAVITYDYGSPLSRVKEYSVWCGSISCGSSATFTRISLNTAHGKIKPYSLGKDLEINKLTSYQSVAEWSVIEELISNDNQPYFHRKKEIRLQSNGMFVSAYKFVNDRSDGFKSFVEKLTKIRAVGISFLCDGIMLLLFPTGDLSDYIDFIKDPYDFNKSNQIMPKGCRINLNKLKDSPPDVQPKIFEKNSNSVLQTLSDTSTEPLPSAVNATELIENTVAATANVIKKSGVADVDLCVPQPTKNPSEMRDQDLRLQHLPSLLPLNTPSVLDPRLIKMLQMTDLVNNNGNNQQPMEKPSPIERDLPKDMEKTAKGDVDLRVYQQPPSLYKVRQKEKVASRKVASVLDPGHDFIAVHDTPLSPGPQEIDESPDYSGLPPIIVPLEVAAYQGERNNVQRRDCDNSYGRINWKAISKTVCSNSDANSNLMSSTEKAIISGKHLVETVAVPSASTADMSDSRLTDSSALATPERNMAESFVKPPPIIPLVEVEDNDVIVDRLVIQESSITPPASSTTSSVLSKQSNKLGSSSAYKSSATAKNNREIDDCIFIETTSKGNPASSNGTEDDRTGLTGRGILIPDDLIFVNTPAEDAELILNEFDQRFRTGEADWTMKVHSQMVLRLAEVKKNLDAKSEVYERVTKLLILLTRFRSMGRVELLSRHDCDIASKASRDYLGCACRIKRESGNLECVFLSNLNPTSSAANEFFSAGIKVMNIAAFKKSHLKIKSKR